MDEMTFEGRDDLRVVLTYEGNHWTGELCDRTWSDAKQRYEYRRRLICTAPEFWQVVDRIEENWTDW